MLFLPFLTHAGCRADQPPAHRNDQSAFFQNRNKLSGRDHDRFLCCARLFPVWIRRREETHQGFRRNQSVFPGIHNRLIVDFKATKVMIHRMQQLFSELLAAYPGPVVLLAEKVTFILSFPFCLVEGKFQEFEDLVIIVDPVFGIDDSC